MICKLKLREDNMWDWVSPTLFSLEHREQESIAHNYAICNNKLRKEIISDSVS